MPDNYGQLISSYFSTPPDQEQENNKKQIMVTKIQRRQEVPAQKATMAGDIGSQLHIPMSAHMAKTQPRR